MNTVAPRSPRSYRRPMSVGLALAVATAVGLSFASPAGAVTDVALGPVASTFGVLAGAGVTNTGATTISGNVGDSPDSSIGGFPPGLISNGVIDANNGAAQTAQAQATAAYGRAAAEPTTTMRSTIGTGETLKAGVYESASSLQLNGSLTLDGEGKTNAIFVFKAGSTLNAASSSTVNLINGANACNVYWQVGSSATLESTATFRGTILALTSITAKNGATVDGRLLAQNGAVTLINDTISVPDCSTGGGGGSSSSSTPTSTAPTSTAPTSTAPSSSTPSSTAPASTGAATTGASSTTAPTTVGISPSQGPTGGGTLVQVNGTGYVPGGTTVSVGSQTVPTSGVHVTSATHLAFTMPAHSPGRVNVVVHTTRGTSQRAVFTYHAAALATTAAAGTTTTSLAGTGAPLGTISGIAALLLLGGTVLMVVSRRRPAPRRHR